MDAAESAASARGFIRALYGDSDRVAVLAVERGGTPPNVHQRIARADHAAADPFQRWLRYLNAQGHDIFIGMNPIRPGTRGRYKADVAEVRRLQLDLDADGPESLRRVLADAEAGRLPQPAIVVRSSERRYQVLWHAAPGWSGPEAEDTMARLAQHYGGDHVNDIARCMRLPGFRNKKDGRDDAPVRWTDYAGPPVERTAFGHLPALRKEPRRADRRTRPRGPRPLSQSERDWAFARDQLRDGVQPDQLVAALERQRQDKHDPADYARRTVENAVDSLRREEGWRPRPQPRPERTPGPELNPLPAA